jgi:SsrA-binding protein
VKARRQLAAAAGGTTGRGRARGAPGAGKTERGRARSAGAGKAERTVIARNRRARHDYHIEDVVEAGLVLTGTEVKSLRAGRASLTDGFAQISDGEMWLYGVHIPEYAQGTWTNHEPRRPRKLLLHRKEIDKLASEIAERGFTLVPLSLYFLGGRAKVELALARGKRTYDKRQDLAQRDAAREVQRAHRRRG